jgi:hypothetical protein
MFQFWTGGFMKNVRNRTPNVRFRTFSRKL